MKVIDNLAYKGVKYSFKQWFTYNGKMASGYSCEDRSLLRELTQQSITAKSHKDMIDLIDFYIEAYSDLLYTQELSTEAAGDWYLTHINDPKD